MDKIYYLHPALFASETLLRSYFYHSIEAALSAQINPKRATAKHVHEVEDQSPWQDIWYWGIEITLTGSDSILKILQALLKHSTELSWQLRKKLQDE